MKKKKLIIKHEVINTWGIIDSELHVDCDVYLVEHTDCRTGVKMYSLDIGNCPVVTSDSSFFLEKVFDFDPNGIFEILYLLAVRRGYNFSVVNESEEDLC